MDSLVEDKFLITHINKKEFTLMKNYKVNILDTHTYRVIWKYEFNWRKFFEIQVIWIENKLLQFQSKLDFRFSAHCSSDFISYLVIKETPKKFSFRSSIKYSLTHWHRLWVASNLWDSVWLEMQLKSMNFHSICNN